jgi:organic radical activating enzyme
MKARISEIFHSLQGEGIWLGEPTTFVRFAGCNLDCSYCDTPQGRDVPGAEAMELPEVLERVAGITSPGQFVSLTGGEPLLQAAFVGALARELKERGFRPYLETNGSLPEALAEVIDPMDVVAMDIKPPSACGRGLWEQHRRSLEISRGRAFVKLVVCSNTAGEEVVRAARLTAGIDRAIIMVLQPAEGQLSPDMSVVRRYQALAGEHLEHVSIIRQMHKIWNIR